MTSDYADTRPHYCQHCDHVQGKHKNAHSRLNRHVDSVHGWPPRLDSCDVTCIYRKPPRQARKAQEGRAICICDSIYCQRVHRCYDCMTPTKSWRHICTPCRMAMKAIIHG